MPETFTPKTWADGQAGGTPITASELNRIENGVESMDDRVAALETAPPVHVHLAAEITSGTMATARLGTGTASAKTYLRGDQAWVDPDVLSSSSRTASYTLVAADVDTEQVYNSTSAGTFTLPTNASQAITVGKSVPFRQSNTGQLTIAAAAGVTLQARGSAFKLAGQHAVAEARKVATDTWVLYGDIST